jgi:glycosyltransferase involved in cell wall biosynthesis
MKILVVTHTFLPVVGGAEVGIHEIYNRIGKKHEVYILTPVLKNTILQQYGGEDGYYKKASYKVIHFDNIFKVPKKLYKFLGGLIPPFSLSMAIATLKYVKKIKPDVVNFCFFIHTGLAIIFLKIFTKIPVVLSLVGREDTLTDKAPLFWRIYLKFIIKISNVVVSISKYNLNNYNAKNVYIIPYGTDINRFSSEASGPSIRQKFNLRDDQIVLFTLQRLSIEKRVDVVIKAMKHIVSEINDAILIVGGKGPEEEKLKKLTYKLGLQNNIIFAGYIPEQELPYYFSCCDLFVFHSTFETFGVVFAQAFASGKPVVSVRNTAIPEIVEDGKDGLLVDTFDSKGLAGAVLSLIKDKNLYEEMKKNVRRKAENFYDWDKIAERYEKIFIDLKL